MKRSISIIIILIVSFGSLLAGESLFGVSQRSIGMLSMPASGPGMGRSYEIAATDSAQINYLNFAQWSNIGLTAYSVKLGYKAAMGDDGTNNNLFNDAAGFYGGFLSIPVLKKKLVIGAGIYPFSSMEQRYRTVETDSVYRELLVKGGLSKAMFNIAYRPMPTLALALTYEYSFGKLDKNFRYEDDANEYDPLLLSFEHRLYGHGMAVSAQYNVLDKLNLGLVYRPAVDLTIETQGSTNSDDVDQGTDQTLTIPSHLGVGMQYVINKRWRAGLDVQYQDWGSGYKLENNTVGDPFNQYLLIGGGFERIQSSKIFTSLFEKMDFRLGGYYRKLSQTSSGSDVKEAALSLGFSLPLQRFRSKIDFAGIVGKRGDLNSNSYEETFFKVGVSVSALERWFIKLKDL